jgi:hypothetical protein
MKKTKRHAAQVVRRRKEAQERKRLTRLYPWAVSEARGLRRDPISIPEVVLRKVELGLRDRKFRQSHGAR